MKKLTAKLYSTEPLTLRRVNTFVTESQSFYVNFLLDERRDENGFYVRDYFENAKVELKNTSKNIRKVYTADEKGNIKTDLPDGTYKLKVISAPDKFKFRYQTRPANIIINTDRKMFADGLRIVNVHVEDLTDEYVHAYVYSSWCYVKASDIKHMDYRPNNWINHLYKDDTFVISYDKPIKTVVEKTGYKHFENYDVVGSGLLAIDMMEKIKTYSPKCKDIKKIEDALIQKRFTYASRHPEDWRALFKTKEEFDEFVKENNIEFKDPFDG